MAFSKTLTLSSITLTFLLLSSSSSFPSQPLAAARKTPYQPLSLVNKVCSNTSDSQFCKRALFSDPRAKTADRVVITYIAFSSLYKTASATLDLIQSRLDNGAKEKPEVVAGLTGCRGNYKEAKRATVEALGNLDSETYYGFDTLAGKAGDMAKACESGFNVTVSPLAKENGETMKLVEICSVVAALFS